MVIGIGLVLCGIAIAIGSASRSRSRGGRGLRGWRPRPGRRVAPVAHGALKTLVPPLLLLFYAFTVDHLGFIPTAAVMVATTCFALGGTWRSAPSSPSAPRPRST